MGFDNRQSDRVLAAMVMILAGLQACFPIHDPDFHWHLKAGQYISQNRSVPRADPFSLPPLRAAGPGAGPMAGPPPEWINMSWLWDVGLYQLYRVAGGAGLVLAKAVLAMALVLVLVRIRAPGTSLWFSSTVALVAIGPISFRFAMRPEMTSLVLLAAVLVILHEFQARRGTKWILLLPVLVLLWANVHSLFVLGLATIGLAVTGHWIHFAVSGSGRDRLDGRWLLALTAVLLASAGASFLTPFGERGALFPIVQLFEKLDDPFYVGRVDELRNLWKEAFVAGRLSALSPTHWMLAGLVAGAALSFLVTIARLNVARLLVFAAFVYLGYLADRNIGFVALVAAATLASNASERRARATAGRPETCRRVTRWGRSGRGLTFAAVGVAGLTSVPGVLPVGVLHYKSPGLGIRRGLFCHDAARFVRETNLPGNAFTTEWGQASVLIWENGPARKVFFDGRLEVYDRERQWQQDTIWLSLLQGNPGGWRTVFDTYDITHVLVDTSEVARSPGTLRSLARSKRWQLVYIDGVCAVFVRRLPRLAGYLRKHGKDLRRLDLAEAEADRRRAAGVSPPLTQVNRGLTPPARPPGCLAQLWRRRERHVPAPVVLGWHYSRLGCPHLAVRQLRRALVESPQSAFGYYVLATAYAALRSREASSTRPAGHATRLPGDRRFHQMAFALSRALACEPPSRLLRVLVHRESMRLYLAADARDSALDHARSVLALVEGWAGDELGDPRMALLARDSMMPPERAAFIRALRVEAQAVVERFEDEVARK